VSRFRLAGACALLLCVLGCAQAYERGERLYSQGDVPGALDAWRSIPESSREYARAHARLETIEAELAATLARYEKRAEFFEGEGRLAEAVLYYRLALKLDPDRPATLERVQTLFRAQHEQEAAQRERLSRALAAGNLREANAAADKLSRINPFDPGIQIEVRQVYAETGAQVLRSLEDGKRAYANGDRAGAAAAFSRALELDPENEAAERSAAAGVHAPPPPTPSSQEILAEGHFRAGQQAEEQGDPYRAIEEYMAALEVDDKHAGARQRLAALRQELQPRLPGLVEQGKHYFQSEDLEKALSVWHDALLIAPDDQRTKENVDRAERILSRLEEIQTRGP